MRRTPRVAAITDAATGLGRAQARAYADAGWNVALLGRGWDGLEAAAADVRERGREALVLPIDLTDDAARGLAVLRIQDELGPIEAWVAEGLVPRYNPNATTARPPSRRGSTVAELTALQVAVTSNPAALAVAGAVLAGVALGVLSAASDRRRT